MDWEAMRKQEAGGTPLCRDGAGWVEADLSLLALRAAGRCSGGWGCVVDDDLQWLQKCHGVRTARGLTVEGLSPLRSCTGRGEQPCTAGVGV